MKIGFGLWISAALSVIFIRDCVETAVVDHSFPFIHPFHLVHVPLFFISVFLAVIVLLHFLSGEKIDKVSKISLIFFPSIIFPPLLDLVLSLISPRQVSYGYIQEDVWKNLIHSFDPFYKMEAVPPSVRIEVAIVVILAFIYIFLKRRRVFLSLAGSLLIFTVIFLYGSLPAVFVNLFVFFAPLLHGFVRFLHFFSHSLAPEALTSSAGILDDPSILIIELFVTLFLVVVWFLRYDKEKGRALLKNFRWTRALHYLAMVILGLSLYFLNTRTDDLLVFLKVTGILCAIFFAFQFAVVINDIFDIECDKISNKDRTLVLGVLDGREYLKIGFVYLVFSLLFAFLVGDYCFSITLLSVVLSVLYSCPPFRLKRFFPLSSAFIGLEALVAFLLGQISLDKEGILNSAYNPLWCLIFLVFFLSSNIKDLKDTQGDRQCGIYSLPVLIGEAKARKLIAFFVFLSYGMVTFFLYQTLLFKHSPVIPFLSLLFGFVSFLYILKPNAKEKIVFLMYFIFVFLLFFFLRKP